MHSGLPWRLSGEGVGKIIIVYHFETGVEHDLHQKAYTACSETMYKNATLLHYQVSATD